MVSIQLACMYVSLDVARASDHHRQTELRVRAADAGTAASSLPSFPSRLQLPALFF